MTISSNLERWRGTIAPGGSLERLTTVCVPAGGYGEIEVETPIVSDIYRDPTKAAADRRDRPPGRPAPALARARRRNGAGRQLRADTCSIGARRQFGVEIPRRRNTLLIQRTAAHHRNDQKTEVDPLT